MGQPAKYLSDAEVLERWGHAVTRGTMANWRAKKEGPPFVKFGRNVRYPVDLLEAWEIENRHLVPANDN